MRRNKYTCADTKAAGQSKQDEIKILDDTLAGQCRAADCTGKYGKFLAQSSRVRTKGSFGLAKLQRKVTSFIETTVGGGL